MTTLMTAAAKPNDGNPPANAAGNNPQAPSSGKGGGQPNPGQAPAAEGSKPADQGAQGKPAAPAEGEKPKAGEAAKPGEKPKEGDKPPAVGAPDRYEFKAPDGHELDRDVIETFSAAAKTSKLTQEQAQALLTAVVPALHEQRARMFRDEVAKWNADALADKEIGGDETKLKASAARAEALLERFASDRKEQWAPLIEGMGLGSNPEFIRLLARIEVEMSSDTRFVPPSETPAAVDANQDELNKLYPTMAKKK